MLAFLWAEDRNHLIGANGTLPWQLPNDLHYFKTTTTSHTIVMGRKTFASMHNRPLPNRKNIVLTRDQYFTAVEGVVVMHDVTKLMSYAVTHPKEDIFIIGGAQIFAACLDVVDVLYVTKIDAAFDGDVFMPTIDYNQFKCISVIPGQLDAENVWPHTFEIYQRK